jgi:hypothetical protein
MAKYQLRPVVVDHRRGMIVHYGHTVDLNAADLHEAMAEVDRMAVPTGVNCLQILKEDGSVAAHKMTNPETGSAKWG